MENNGYVVHQYHQDGDRMLRADGIEVYKLNPPPNPVVGRSRLVIHEDEYGYQRTVTLVFLRNGQVMWEMPEPAEGLPKPNADEHFPPLNPPNFWEH